MKIDWVAKLTSRKFWMAVVGLVSGLLLAFKVNQSDVDQITGVIMAGASVVAYIIGEGLTDAAAAKSDQTVTYTSGYLDEDTHPPEDDPMEDDGK